MNIARENFWSRSIGFIRRTYQTYSEGHVGLSAAALAYYGIFSLVPLFLLLAGISGFILQSNPELSGQVIEILQSLVVSLFPAGGELASDMVEFLTRGAVSLTIGSVIFLSWAASNFFVALSFAIAEIFKCQATFWRSRLAGLLLPLIGGLGLIVISILNLGFGFVLRYIPEGPWESWLSGIVPIAVITAVMFSIYRFMPQVSPGNLPAALAALGVAIGFDLLRRLLPIFIPRSSYEAIYGPLAGLALILLGFYIAMSILLVGAVILADFTSKNPQPRKSEVGVDHLEGRADRG